MRSCSRLFILLILMMLPSCSPFKDSADVEKSYDENLTYIRVKNATKFDFKNVQVDPANLDTLVSYGDIKRGARTDYKPFEVAYRIAYVRLLINNEERLVQPIDYFGEAPLDPGRYTYIISTLEETEKFLDLVTVKDD